ncbi:hypothetical protein B7Z28_01755 [Candidatus Saccharibacteria bacterium 32-45-3]|nr:MAG: hypothetical protein B7Z28_01755 [Candidatus Saccharibacteria bacterium 32-45-3]
MEKHIVFLHCVYYLAGACPISFLVIFVTWFVSVMLRKQLSFRLWKYLHYFSYISLPFALLHIPNLGSQYARSEFVQLYFLIIVGMFIMFSLIRILALFDFGRRPYRIVANDVLSDEDRLLVIRPINTALRVNHGQFVYIKIGRISEDHPFSIAHIDDESGEITIAYRLKGLFTRLLSRSKAGTILSIAGPYGSFMQNLTRKNTTPVVYIAGGIGIAPFVQKIISEDNVRQQIIFCVNRTRASAVFVPLLKRRLGLRCISLLTREPATDTDLSGHFSNDILRTYVTSPENYTYYVCGPEPFEASVKNVLHSAGVQKEVIYTERFNW